MNCLICERRPMRQRGMCNACYSKARRMGTIAVRQRAAPRLCAVPGCGERTRSLDWCKRHYAYYYRYGSPIPPSRPHACTICGRPVVAIGWCAKHYQHHYRYGTPLSRKERAG